AESSFKPRTSRDGGQGLFQITQAPKQALAMAKDRLGIADLSLNDHRQNAFVAAATLVYYLDEMDGDLFLALLAYNIGPANGGLRFIMQKYGARDFVTIQPYLTRFPRDYPIRVLSNALAFRLWRHEKKLSSYEAGNNAVRIQKIGIPGLNDSF
ncbi:MAG: transglycosylase SLT domain-containing protein, partial [Gammaproteobacteria bacterium]